MWGSVLFRGLSSTGMEKPSSTVVPVQGMGTLPPFSSSLSPSPSPSPGCRSQNVDVGVFLEHVKETNEALLVASRIIANIVLSTERTGGGVDSLENALNALRLYESKPWPEVLKMAVMDLDDEDEREFMDTTRRLLNDSAEMLASLLEPYADNKLYAPLFTPEFLSRLMYEVHLYLHLHHYLHRIRARIQGSHGVEQHQHHLAITYLSDIRLIGRR